MAFSGPDRLNEIITRKIKTVLFQVRKKVSVDYKKVVSGRFKVNRPETGRRVNVKTNLQSDKSDKTVRGIFEYYSD